MPSRIETSYAGVARYLASRERDPYERVKAIHDYIATRIGYEYPFDRSRLPPSDPETVFARRTAVCAGYARLFGAMLEAIGVRSVYISGDARFATESVAGASHAWNAVEIEGRWYLVDVTWDAGVISRGKFEKKYRTDFLLTPPRFFVISHLPRSEKWQLLDAPITRGEFYRQPLLFPAFIAFDLELLEPTRSQVSVSGAVRVVLDNPGGHSLVVESFRGGEPRRSCAVEEGRRTVATCDLSADGDYVVYVFAALRGEVIHELVAKLEVNNDT
jgi:transglutaminase/protease-like cytokinesis protein 3